MESKHEPKFDSQKEAPKFERKNKIFIISLISIFKSVISLPLMNMENFATLLTFRHSIIINLNVNDLSDHKITQLLNIIFVLGQ